MLVGEHYYFDRSYENELGRGAFGLVYKGHDKRNGNVVAVKEIFKANLNMVNIERENEITMLLKSINHENIVTHYHTESTDRYIYIMMEFCNYYDLESYYDKHAPLNMSDMNIILKQLAIGLQLLYSNHIIHRNLKPKIILLHNNKNLQDPLINDLTLKIAGFGLSRFISNNTLATTVVGTPIYMAPEVYTQETYDHKADVWSVGLIVYKGLFGRLPEILIRDHYYSYFKFWKDLHSRNEEPEIEFPFYESSKLIQLLRKSLIRDVASRMDMLDFLNLILTEESQPGTSNNELSDLPQELRIPPTSSDISFIDSLYDKLPSSMRNILKKRQCKIVFPDDTQEYEFHEIKRLHVIKTTHNIVRECMLRFTTRTGESKRVLAVKEINIPRSRFITDAEKDQVKKLLQEIQTHLSLLNSQNIVALYGFCVCDGETLKLGMELMKINVEDLHKMVHQNNKNFPEDLFACIGVSVINALEACGKNKIVHRDIKPSNVLLDEQGIIKLCDFGESRSMKDEEYLRTFVGTAYYLAPERLEDEPYDRRADIWSFGIMLAEIAHGKIPYLDKNGKTPTSYPAIHRCIMNTKAEEIIQRCIKPRKYNSAIEDLVGLCLAELEKRPEKYEMLKNTRFYAHFSNIVNERIVVEMLNKLKDSGLLTT